MRIGIETAFSVANEQGGVNGRLLKLVTADDGYEPTRTADTMKQLYDQDQVFGFIGNVGTATAAVAYPFALDRRALFFGAFSGADILRHEPPDRYVFNYRASYAEETGAVVRYLVSVRRLKPEQIAVFAQQDSYGDAGFAGVTKAMRALRGGDGGFVLRVGYQRNTVDVDPAIAQLKANKTPIKAVVMVATYRAAAKFIERTKDAYPGLIYSNVSFVGSTSLRDELLLLGPRYAQGVIVTQVVPAVDGYSSLILEYKNALAKYFGGEAPDYVSLEGYVAAKVLVEALKSIGTAARHRPRRGNARRPCTTSTWGLERPSPSIGASTRGLIKCGAPSSTKRENSSPSNSNNKPAGRSALGGDSDETPGIEILRPAALLRSGPAFAPAGGLQRRERTESAC